MRRYSVQSLHRFVDDVAVAVGLLPEHAARLSRGLVEAELRGVPSHGLARLHGYARAFVVGALNPRPTYQVLQERTATVLMDGDNGLGIVTGQVAMEVAIERARVCGIGVVSVRNSNHTGMLAVHAMEATRAGMIGYFVSNGPALMAPWGGRDALLSNNPVAYGFPTPWDWPLVLDMACSVVARGKIRLAAARGETIPPGWALDGMGQPTTSAVDAMAGTSLPMAEHKGSGLAVVHEILASVLPGARASYEIAGSFSELDARAFGQWGNGHLAVAIDPTAFCEMEVYMERIDGLVRTLQQSTPAEGHAVVRVPGELEAITSEERRRSGVPLAPDLESDLVGLAVEVGVAELLPC